MNSTLEHDMQFSTSVLSFQNKLTQLCWLTNVETCFNLNFYYKLTLITYIVKTCDQEPGF